MQKTKTIDELLAELKRHSFDECTQQAIPTSRGHDRAVCWCIAFRIRIATYSRTTKGNAMTLNKERRNFYAGTVEDDSEEDDINVLATIKDGKERYIFCYKPAHNDELIRTLSRFAANDDLSFNWYDAAVLCHKVRNQNG